MAQSMQSLRRSEVATGWLMNVPALLLLFVFLVFPFFMSFGLALSNQRLIPIRTRPTAFVGFDNFVRLFQDEAFYGAVLNNFYFTAVVVPLVIVIGLSLALLVIRDTPFRRLCKTVYFVPVVLSEVVVATIWGSLLNPRGFVNTVLEFVSFGMIEPVGWLIDTRSAFPSIMFIGLWKNVGFQMVIFIAGLQSIPKELYEAATVDGASRVQKFWLITIPQLRNTLVFVLVTNTIYSFGVFGTVQILTDGGPRGSTMVTMLYMYREGFVEMKIGYAAAVSTIYFLIVLAVSIVQRFLVRERSAPVQINRARRRGVRAAGELESPA